MSYCLYKPNKLRTCGTLPLSMLWLGRSSHAKDSPYLLRVHPLLVHDRPHLFSRCAVCSLLTFADPGRDEEDSDVEIRFWAQFLKGVYVTSELLALGNFLGVPRRRAEPRPEIADSRKYRIFILDISNMRYTISAAKPNAN